VLDRGQAHGVIRVLPGFARDLARGRATEVQVLLDGTTPTPRRWFPRMPSR